MYIVKYKIIHKTVITKSKRWENDKYILHENHNSKTVWQIINKETGRTSSTNKTLK